MSKYDGEIRAASAAVGLDEVLGMIGQSRVTAASRSDALAHFLSGEEGWRDARAALHGAFASDAGTAGLIESSEP